MFYRMLLSLCLFFFSFSASSHETRPAIIDVIFKKNASVELHMQVNIETLVAEISPQHKNTDNSPQAEVYKQLRQLSASQLQQKFKHFEPSYRSNLKLLLSNLRPEWSLVDVRIPDVGDTRLSRKSKLIYRAPLTSSITSATWQYDLRYGDSAVHFVTEGSDKKISYWLPQGKISPVFSLSENLVAREKWDVASDYLQLGFIHIIPKGLDHILFVLGLFLLSLRLKPLLWQISTFTVAHSITLGLSIYGLIQLSPLIIEPLIALSIAYIGIENLLTRELKPWRVLIVFLFGLLHGMGFAGVLTDLGLPEPEFLTALITFNIGVEFGQLSVILVAFLLLGWLSRKPDIYRKFVIIPASSVITLIGFYWTWERVFAA